MKQVLARPVKKLPTLRGKTIVTAFYEASTRPDLVRGRGEDPGADAVNMTASASSVTKGESLLDTIRTLQAIGADMVVMRIRRAARLGRRGPRRRLDRQRRRRLARPPHPGAPGPVHHRERLGRVEGLKVTILGDVLHSRVARPTSGG